MAEVLITMRMTGVRDVAAIEDWVRLHADEDEARKLKASLPSLAVGTGWLWSPRTRGMAFVLNDSDDVVQLDVAGPVRGSFLRSPSAIA